MEESRSQYVKLSVGESWKMCEAIMKWWGCSRDGDLTMRAECDHVGALPHQQSWPRPLDVCACVGLANGRRRRCRQTWRARHRRVGPNRAPRLVSQQ